MQTLLMHTSTECQKCEYFVLKYLLQPACFCFIPRLRIWGENDSLSIISNLSFFLIKSLSIVVEGLGQFLNVEVNFRRNSVEFSP